jgi:hypothetical protein
MEKLKQSFKDKLLNEDVMFNRITEKTKQKSYLDFVNIKVLITLSIVLTLIIAIVINNSSPLNPVKNTTQIGISTPQNKLAYAIVSVDINPSFELYIDIDDKVIEIIPLNDEAKTLSYESFIGLPVQDAVEEIIRKAQDAGFIDITNTTPNTVAATTITATTSIMPAADNTGVIGNATTTWSNGQFTNLTIDSTLTVRAAIDLADSDVLRMGSSDDWQIFYNGTTNEANVELESACLGITYTNNGTEIAYLEKSTGTYTAKQLTASNGIVTNSKTVSASFTIPATDNASSAGPITIASGVTVTVSSGSRWVVL